MHSVLTIQRKMGDFGEGFYRRLAGDQVRT